MAEGEQGAVLVTGASTGIGRACALHLADTGFRVFGGVRRAEDAEALRAAGGGRITPVRLDITDAAQVAEAARLVAESAGGLRALVNNAGIAVPAPVEILPLAELRRQLEVNTVGQVAVTQAFLPLLRRSRRPATAVFISSAAGRFASPVIGAYAASKFALEALADALRVELRPWGVRVVSVQPGNIATPIWEKTLRAGGDMVDALPAAVRAPYQPLIDLARAGVRPMQGISPLAVARAVRRAITAQRPRARYLVGADARAAALLALLPERLRDWVIAKRMPAAWR